MDRTIVTMERRDNKIYLVETVIFQGETFVINHIRVTHDDRFKWHVILPDHTIISADRLKTLYKNRKSIVDQYNDSECWCYNHGEKPFRLF